MVELNDRVAVIALAVSLVALLIASVQLLALSLSTAEGYRRCSEAVIGPWHRLRSRQWIWTEFRYETHFVTPKIMLYSQEEFLTATAYEHRSGLHFLKDITTNTDGKRRYGTFCSAQQENNIIANGCAVVGATVRENAVLGVPVSEWEQGHGLYPGFVEKKRVVIRAGAEDKPQHQHLKVQETTGPVTSTTGLALPDENRVSWLRLLGSLHHMYSSYQTNIPVTSKLHFLPHGRRVLSSVIRGASMTEEAATRQTGAVVEFLRWSWDLMPQEVSKPLATTTLGALVIFAARLDMQWRVLDKQKKQLYAQGNGYNLSVTETPGVGWVAKLSEMSRPGASKQYIPSQAVDKMICNIIPGCWSLVGFDFVLGYGPGSSLDFSELVKVKPAWPLPSLLSRQAYLESMEVLQAHAPDWPFGLPPGERDVMVLLSEFLPLPGCRASAFCCYGWGWYSDQAIFETWEGRRAMRRYLQQYSSETTIAQDMEKVLSWLLHLEAAHTSDFYHHPFGTYRAAGGHEGVQKQIDLQHDCRQIFEWTTGWFISHGYAARDSQHKKTHYTHLVTAHWWLAYKMWTDSLEEEQRLKQERRGEEQRSGDEQQSDGECESPLKCSTREQLHEQYGLEDGVPATYERFSPRYYDRLTMYAENVRSSGSYFHAYMRDLGTRNFDVFELEIAWWMLMLRGIAWVLPVVEVDYHGEPIPPTMYDDHTPVWIT